MSRLALRFVVLLAVVLAGCNGLPAGSSDNSTITPADVPTDSTIETSSGQLAPGVFPVGVDASTLAHAHARALNSTTFTIQTNRTYRYPNGTVREWISSETIVESVSSPQFKIYSRTNFSPSFRDDSETRMVTYEQWYTADHWYQRQIFANNTTTYRANPPSPVDSFQWSRGWMIENTLTDVEAQVTPHDRNGSTYYRIEGPVSSEYAVSSSDNQNNATQWLLVDSNGLVHEHHMNTTLSGPNVTTQRIHLSTSYNDIHSATIPRPSWVDTARKRTNAMNQTESDDKRNSTRTTSQ
ncbi:DUF7537 family lipoprotein [Halocatena marina]|uniref:DUF7537 family lipoprotein n=1 Tax=Halocatena marina TaxID=2934937 RepID=UPI00200ED832|nr:hypothetical protein [Halocatena marina]